MRPRLATVLACTIVCTITCTLATAAGAQASAAVSRHQAEGREVLRELVETNTAWSSGSTTRAAELLAARFRAAGFPAADVQLVGPDTGNDAKDRNLVVRYRGSGKRRPVLLIGHLDVVEARRADWVRDPFTLTEHEGHFYGRGVLDMKSSDAAWVTALLRMKREGVVPPGDFILALTAGEEGGGGYNGMRWILQHRRELLDAEYVLNADMGVGELRGGRPAVLKVLAAEKVVLGLTLTTRNVGGHSSLPVKDNAIVRVAHALSRIAAHDFPARTTSVTRSALAFAATQEQGPTAADLRLVSTGDAPDSAAAARLAAGSTLLNAMLRTTCVTTMIEGGHAPNALPQRATATVNCRVLPGEDPADVQRTIVRVIGDTAVVVEARGTPTPSPPSPLPPALERKIDAVTTSMWGRLPIVQTMSTFATDGLALRNVGMPVYGVNGLFADPANPADANAHGLDERIGVRAFHDQLEFAYRLLKAL
jgi:acetylornithine deacetylase/succinyl-diaminopimelate desuccinylase-like protein